MVYYHRACIEGTLDATFGALSDPTRRAILARLSQGESTVKVLAAPFNMSLPAVSKHLRVLESAGLLKREIDGRIHRCRLDADPLKDAAAFMEHYRHFWETQFDALQEFLESTDGVSGSVLASPESTKEQNRWQPHNKVKTRPASRSKSGARSPYHAKGS